MKLSPPLDRVVVVGASLAGLSVAQEVRRLGFYGRLTVIGEEPHLPYDRPPLTKGVLTGRLAADQTQLPLEDELDVEWVLGVAATALDRKAREVVLADGRRVTYDRLVISTGSAARPWPQAGEARLQGVLTVRTRDDAADLAGRLAARPRRVLVVGAGFIGSEVASSCRELGLDVTVVDLAQAPLQAPLGQALGAMAARLQQAHGVDLRSRTSVARIHDEGSGHVRAVTLDDGTMLEVDLVVVAVGSVPATGWLAGSGIVLTPEGSVTCDDTLRVRTDPATTNRLGVDPSAVDSEYDDACYAAGDVTAVPHPTYDGAVLAVEHWGTAVEHGRTAAHNLLRAPAENRHVTALPRFWSNQFGLNLKSAGVTSVADQMLVAEGSLEQPRGVLLYGRGGTTVAAVSLNAPRELEPYAALVECGAPFPPELKVADRGEPPAVVPVRSTGAAGTSHEPEAEVVSRPTAFR